jgi:cephalosporin hydroxylase
MRRPVRGAAAWAVSPAQAEAWAARTASPLARSFLSHRGRIAHKWVHYCEVYEPHFARFVGSEVKLLEIGVSQGGSLELWRDYFGEQATIFGIDIDPACRTRYDPPNQVRIGSQDDPDFLRSVVAEMGGIDLVIDDASHIGRHQRASFKALFPLLNEGGLYVIEDLLTSYWPGHFEGGYRRPGTGIELIKGLIDDMHADFHDHSGGLAGPAIPAIHVYSSTAVIEKRTYGPMGHFRIGGLPT